MYTHFSAGGVALRAGAGLISMVGLNPGGWSQFFYTVFQRMSNIRHANEKKSRSKLSKEADSVTDASLTSPNFHIGAFCSP